MELVGNVVHGDGCTSCNPVQEQVDTHVGSLN